jgi:hypothetical protein
MNLNIRKARTEPDGYVCAAPPIRLKSRSKMQPIKSQDWLILSFSKICGFGAAKTALQLPMKKARVTI